MGHGGRLAVVVCTKNPPKARRLLASLQAIGCQRRVVVIVDGACFITRPEIDDLKGMDLDLHLHVNCENVGLAASRNVGLDLAQSDRLVYFDDDVILETDVLTGYERLFDLGFQVVGGPLRLPQEMRAIPAWLPPRLSSLVGIHSTEAKIWGGNMGFAFNGAMRPPLFREELGRRGMKLGSGEDTSFIQELVQAGAKTIFDYALAVDHHIDRDRFRIGYLARRAYWQGRSEVRRRNLRKGIAKEYGRAFSTSPVEFRYALARWAMGTLLFAAFLVGVFSESIVNLSATAPRSPCLDRSKSNP